MHEHLNHKADRFVHLIFMLIQSYRNIYTHACKLIVLMFNIVYLHCKHKVFFLSFFLGFYFFGGGKRMVIGINSEKPRGLHGISYSSYQDHTALVLMD